MNPEDETGQPRKKPRGPYKQYLWNPSIPIPRTTIFSRENAQGAEAAMARNDCLQAANIPNADPDADSNQEFPHEMPENNPGVLSDEGNNEDFQEDSNLTQHPEPCPIEDAPFDKDEQGSKAKRSYVEKHRLSELLHKELPTTRLDALLMILHLAIRHCHTQHFVEDLISFVNVLFGENVLDVSYYVFKTLFKSAIDICKHYFCKDCEFYLGSEQDFIKPQCPECEKIIEAEPDSEQVQCLDCEFIGSREKHLVRVKVSKCIKCKKSIDVYSVDSDNYFVTLPLRTQIEEILRKPGLKLVSRADRLATGISDVFDGEIYRKLSQPGYPLENENSLTVTFNTDGVQVHKSTTNSLWPIQLYINEVVPEHRFKRDNLIVAGLWFGKSAPNMALYLKPFLEELLDLSVNGVDYKKPDGTQVKCCVYPLCCSVDSVAKPKLICQKQFNAKMGCLYCYHPNDSIIGDNKKVRYYDQNVNHALRCEEDILRDMLEADRLSREDELKLGSVNGFLGISILTMCTRIKDYFPCSTFNLMWGIVIDYMHAALEGVAAGLFNIYENTLTAKQLETLDDYIMGITPPQGMTRRPRSFSLRPSWKAKEFRAVLLFYALPCLQDLLPQRDFLLLKHFVIVLHTLLSDNISYAALSKAASSLSSFCSGYQRLYGLQNVSYNLHIFRHLVDMVIQQGPLWCYSNFVFESGNGYLINLVKGTKSIINEIAVKHTTVQTVSKFITENEVSPNVLSFCSETINCKYSSKNEIELDNVLTTGSQSYAEISYEECFLLEEKNVIISAQRVQYYNRVIRNGIVYCSKSYSRAKVYDDSCVLLCDNSYAVIDKIVKSSENKLLCLIRPIRIAQGADIIPFIKTCCYDVYNSPKVVPFSEISRKCILVNVKDKSFVCDIPNFYERD